MPDAEIIHVSPWGAVPIRFGQGMDWTAGQISTIASGRTRLFVISDARVSLLYEASLTDSLRERGFDVFGATFDPGERHKTLRTAAQLLDEMAQRRLARDDMVIGLGGGVATDIAGFAASIYQRGIRWIAVPTTVMGMVDAAIGGKTGVDHPLGKNLLGTFHQPAAVLAATDALKTLPPREWAAGSAEVVKSALLSGGGLWSDVERFGPDLRAWSPESALLAMQAAARIKAEIVSQDEKESGLRRLLNLGHTFGHAVEAVTRYQTFLHGEAVFLGLRAAVELSKRHGLMSEVTAAEIASVLARVSTPYADMSADSLLNAIGSDKKIRSRSVNWILLKQPGEPEIVSSIRPEVVREVGEWLCSQARTAARTNTAARRPRILVLNGPNLNLLGEREPQVYGSTSYEQMEALLHGFADEQNVEMLVRQSNVEGDMVSLIQQGRHWADGIIINPGGYTHTSVAIRDALAAVTLPAVEVHLTDIALRDDFRRTSLVADVCRASIAGKGVDGYFEAVRELKTMIEATAA